MNILGIRRSPQYSPNSVDRDFAIFSAVVSQLQKKGHHVSTISEDLFIAVDLEEFDLVFSMARGKEVLTQLSSLEEKRPKSVFNSASKLLIYTRSHLVQDFKQNNIPQPEYTIYNTKEVTSQIISTKESFPFWIKSGNSCAKNEKDVCFIQNEMELEDALQYFLSHDSNEIIIVNHLKGDLIKFYGVEGTDFFKYSYPTENNGFSKFGLESHNGSPHHYVFDETSLRTETNRAAQITGYTIYGGDAIITSNGAFYIIDFNDWPSFSSCRKEAAKSIAQRICGI